MADFPIGLTNVVAGVTEIQAKHINNIEAKVGIDGSAVVTSLDYLLKNAGAIDPGHGHTLAALTDVTALPAELNLLDLAGLTAGHVLRATGAAAAAWGAIEAGDLPTGIDAAKIADGSVSNAEFQYLGGVTSDLQAQLNSKQGLDATLTALAGLTTAQGDLLYATGENAFAMLNKSTGLNQFLKNSGADNGPAWASLAESDLPDLTAYAKLAGRATGQTLNGGTGASENLTLDSTAHATKGYVLLNPSGGNVGIGTPSPAHPLDILVSSNYGLRVISTAALGASSGGTASLYANNIPTAADQRLGRFVFGMYDQPTGNFAETAIAAAFSEEAWVYATNRGTYLRFETTAPGGTSRSEKLRISGAGNIGINQTTFGMSAAKVLAIGSGTDPTSSPADAVQLWSADRGGTAGKAGLHIRSEDGTSHVLSDYVGIGTTTPGYLLDVGAGNVRITQNVGIGTATPSTYNNAGAEYFVSINRTITDATASATKRNIDCNVAIQPSAEAAVYYQGISAIADIAAATAYNLNGYLRAFQAICYHRANTTLNAMYGVYAYPAIYNGGSDSTGTITSLYGIYIGSAKTASSTITNAYGLYITGITGTTAYDIYCGGASNKNYFAGSVGIGTTTFGTSATKTLALGNGTAPSSSPSDSFQLYSADQAAGNACPHFRTENGAIIKLFQGAALTAALTTMTHTAPGTPDYAIQDLTNSGGYGFVTKDEGNTVLSVIANLQARVNELESRLKAHGLLA